MSCIAKGNTRCTKCCEVIHIPLRQWVLASKGKMGIGASAPILKYWKRISKRQAKKINPYMFNRQLKPEWHKRFIGDAAFFTCSALIPGVGCSIRDDDDHPFVCKVYKGGTEYSPTCPTDINIIARG